MPGGEGSIDALGAAAPLPVKDESRRSRRTGSRLRRLGGGGPLRRAVIVLVVIFALALMPTVLSSLEKTPRNMVGISYGGGPVESAHFQRIVMPGSGLFFNGLLDPLYLYPADTQSYIVSKTEGEGSVTSSDSIVAPSRDRVQIEYQIAVYFRLNIDQLRAFHDQLGFQYEAYSDAGWDRLIQNTFRQQIENTLQQETRRYEVAELFGDAEDLATIQAEVEAQLGTRLESALGRPFFCGPTYQRGGTCTPPRFIIKQIGIPDDVAKAFEAHRTSQIEVLQRTAQAEAIKALNASLAEAGMPYVLLRAIESGKVTFWVLPTENGLTLEAPGAGGAAPASPGSSETTTTTSSR
jgi:hypothetical protein